MPARYSRGQSRTDAGSPGSPPHRVIAMPRPEVLDGASAGIASSRRRCSCPRMTKGEGRPRGRSPAYCSWPLLATADPTAAMVTRRAIPRQRRAVLWVAANSTVRGMQAVWRRARSGRFFQLLLPLLLAASDAAADATKPAAPPPVPAGPPVSAAADAADLCPLHEPRPAEPARGAEPGAGLVRAWRGASGRALRRGGADRARQLPGGGDPSRGAGQGDDDGAGVAARRCARPGRAGLAAGRRSGARLCRGGRGGSPAAGRSRSVDRPRRSGGLGRLLRPGHRRSRPGAEDRPRPGRCADLSRLGLSRARPPRPGARRYRQGAGAAPHSAAALLERGNIRRLEGDPAGARRDWEEIGQVAPGSPEDMAARANLEHLAPPATPASRRPPRSARRRRNERQAFRAARAAAAQRSRRRRGGAGGGDRRRAPAASPTQRRPRRCASSRPRRGSSTAPRSRPSRSPTTRPSSPWCCSRPVSSCPRTT